VAVKDNDELRVESIMKTSKLLNARAKWTFLSDGWFTMIAIVHGYSGLVNAITLSYMSILQGKVARINPIGASFTQQLTCGVL
jgi:hypothetical protein